MGLYVYPYVSTYCTVVTAYLYSKFGNQVVLAFQCAVLSQNCFGYSRSFVFSYIYYSQLVHFPHYSKTKRKHPRSVVGIAWNLWKHLGRIVIFTMFSLTVHEFGMSLQLVKLNLL